MAAGTITIGDLEVNRLGYGAMRITGEGIWGPPRDHDESLAVLRRAVELGVTLIDTADSYGPNVSEELIAEALYPYPDGLVIATKGGKVRPGPGRVGRRRTARAPPRGVPRLAGAPAARADRRLPAPRPRPERPARGVGRHPEGAAGRGQDPPHRALERQRRRARARRGGRADRVGAEPVPRRRPLLGGCARGVRAARDPVPALVSARRRQGRLAGRRARRAAEPLSR